MADSPVLPPVGAVNDPASPQKPDIGALLEAVLLGCHAALFVESLFKMRRAHDAGTSDLDAKNLDSMHCDIYDVLDDAIADLAKASHCPAKFRNLATSMQKFFGAECAQDQNRQRLRIIRSLKHLAASDAGIYPRFDVLRQLFAQLSQEHAIPPDSVEQASFALTG